MASTKEKIFTHDFIVLFVINLIVVLIQSLFLTTMAYYSMQHFHVDGSAGGITASIFMFGAVAGRILIAHYATASNLRKFCFISLVTQLIACAAYLLNDIGYAFLLAVRVFHGLSFGIANTAIPTLAIDTIPKERLGEGTGYFMLSTSLGIGIGPLMTIMTTMGIDYFFLFLAAVGLAIVALALSFFLRPAQDTTSHPATHQEKSQTTKHRKWTLGSIVDLSTIRISFFMFLLGFGCSSITSFASSYAASLDMPAFAPILFLMYSIGLIITRPIAGKLMDRFGENLVLYPSMISMACGLAVAACVVHPAMLASCGIFMATGFGVSMSVGQAVVVKDTKSSNTAIAISTFFLLCDMGIGLGPFFLGMIVENAGYRPMYWQCVVVTIAALLYYHFSHGRKGKGTR